MGGKGSNDGDPVWVITAFVDSRMEGQAVRIGWVRADVTDGVGTPRGVATTSRVNETAKWLRAKASAHHSELLLAVLYVAAAYFSLCGCVGARLGRSVSSVEGLLECKHYIFVN